MANQADLAAIRRYENMSADEINAELRTYGIDPQPTIKAVTTLVRKKLEELNARRSKRQ